MIYIHKEIGYYTVAETLSNNYEIGKTIVDYYNGKFVLLSEMQILFREQHPGITIKEVFNMQLNPAMQPTLEMAKIAKIAEIEAYDTSPAVNTFIINEVPMWLDRNTRTSLLATISAYKANGIISITLWTTGSNPVPVTLLVTQLEELLIGLEMYAKACYDVTAQHKANVQALTTAEIVINYDYKVGYPGKLTITV